FRDRTSELIAGDCSDSQYFYPGTAARIHAEHPDTKIVAVLRHPVERAYSGFNHARSSGMELESDFSRCMQRSLEEEAALSPIMRYKSLGMYGALLGPFLSTFGRQKMLLLNFADVTSDFGKVALEISRFLSIPVFEVNHVWANQTLVPPASGPGAWLYTIARPFRSALKGTTSESKTRLAITRVKEHVFERPEKLSERVRSKYMPLFRKDVSRLSTDFGPGFWDNWR
ncbi:MAG: sulfotransferase domain-containing protein, partial [Alphaproteobacteria bacterium]